MFEFFLLTKSFIRSGRYPDELVPRVLIFREQIEIETKERLLMVRLSLISGFLVGDGAERERISELFASVETSTAIVVAEDEEELHFQSVAHALQGSQHRLFEAGLQAFWRCDRAAVGLDAGRSEFAHLCVDDFFTADGIKKVPVTKFSSIHYKIKNVTL